MKHGIFCFMNILLTGEPHVGKSTLISNVVSGVENKQGFITTEVTEKGQRMGFELVSALGDRAILASVYSPSRIRVSRYGVNVDILESFIRRLPEVMPGTLLYIDEIGQMELFSPAFRQLAESFLDLPNPFIGTLSSVYSDEFTDSLRARTDLEIVNLTFDNRNLIHTEISEQVAKLVQ
jgi:nucleoside-triphosphatase